MADEKSLPPVYTPPTTRPPSYHVAAQIAPEVALDENAIVPVASTRGLSELPTSPTSTISRAATTLGPFSTVPHPTASPIPEHSWKAFMSELRSAVSPSNSQKALAIVAGTGVSIATHWIPLGAVIGALVWRRAIAQRLAEELGTSNVTVAKPSCKQRKSVHQIVDHYNAMWQALGVRVRIESVDETYVDESRCSCEVEWRKGCGSKMVPYIDGRRANGCCSKSCHSCGKPRSKRCGKLREKARQPLVQISVERLEAVQGTAAYNTQDLHPAMRDLTLSGGPPEVGIAREKAGWVDDVAA